MGMWKTRLLLGALIQVFHIPCNRLRSDPQKIAEKSDWGRSGSAQAVGNVDKCVLSGFT
jgi:hypothetical protein